MKKFSMMLTGSLGVALWLLMRPDAGEAIIVAIVAAILVDGVFDFFK